MAEAGEVSQEEQQTAAEQAQDESQISGKVAALQLDPLDEAIEQGNRGFLAHRKFHNLKKLVTVGKVVSFPNPLSPMGVNDRKRDGDIWVKFKEGLLVTKVPEVIEWCLRHPDVCRPSEDPTTAAWLNLKNAQTPRANSEATLGPEMNVDKLFEAAGAGEALGDAVLKEKSEPKVAAANRQVIDADQTQERTPTEVVA